MQRAALARTTVSSAIMISDIRFKDFEDALATAGSLYVLRLGVRADELNLIQRLAQAIAAELTLSRSFERVQ